MDRPPEVPPERGAGLRAVSAAELLVRPAREDELDAAGAVVARAYAAEGYAVGGYLAALADARDRARDATVAVAVRPTGEIVGSVTLALPGSRWAELCSPGEAEFRALGVTPAARGLGIGRALTQWCLDEARRRDAQRLVLCSLDAMHGAHRLYHRLGFRRRPDLDREPEPGVVLLGFDRDLADRSAPDGTAPSPPDTPRSADAHPGAGR